MGPAFSSVLLMMSVLLLLTSRRIHAYHPSFNRLWTHPTLQRSASATLEGCYCLHIPRSQPDVKRWRR